MSDCREQLLYKAPSPSLVKEFGADFLNPENGETLYEIALNKFHDSTFTKGTPRYADIAKLHSTLDTATTVFGQATL